MKTISSILVVATLLVASTYALDDGMWPTPLMGWNSYNSFHHDLTEDSCKGIADQLVALGLRDLGYNYIIIDDGWQAPERDADGNLQPNPDKFPNGMAALADYLHSKGVYLGLYSDAGLRACGQNVPGSLGSELKDITLLATWKVDYLKYDNCFPASLDKHYNINYLESILNFPSIVQKPAERERYGTMGDALQQVKSIHPMTFEMCLYGFDHVEEWGPKTGHHWRTNTDPKDNWFTLAWNIDTNDEDRLAENQGPTKGWNYVGEMYINTGGMTTIEYKTYFAWHSIVKTPLILGMDIREMVKGDIGHQIITNPNMLAIHQDTLGKQARCLTECSQGILSFIHANFWSSIQIWQGPLSSDGWVVMVVNRYLSPKGHEFDWNKDAQIPAGSYDLYEAWTNEKIATITSPGSYKIDNLESHEHALYKLVPAKTTDAIVSEEDRFALPW